MEKNSLLFMGKILYYILSDETIVNFSTDVS